MLTFVEEVAQFVEVKETGKRSAGIRHLHDARVESIDASISKGKTQGPQTTHSIIVIYVAMGKKASTCTAREERKIFKQENKNFSKAIKT